MIYEINDLCFSYNKDKPVLSDVSLKIEDGELVTLLGRNGAGKSTLFSCMLNVNPGYTGSIRLLGRELKQLKEKDIANAVSFVPQNVNPTFAFSVFDFVLLGCASRIGLFGHPGREDEDAAMEALSILGIEDYADRSFSELSGGERQQVTIARALAARPKAILFDEPTAHLDYSNQVKVLRVIKALSEKGYTIAVTTHDPNHALLLSGSVVLFDGKGGVSKGSTEEMITAEKLAGVYGSDIKIRYLEEFKRSVCIYPRL